MILLQSQKNTVFRAIESAGLDPRDFRWTDSKSNATVTHVPTGFYFRFEGGANWFEVAYYPIATQLKEYGHRIAVEHNTNFFAGVAQLVSEWAQVVKRESDESDLWAAVTASTSLLQNEPTDTSQFTDAQLVRIEESIEELRTYIQSRFELSKRQQQVIEQSLQILLQEAKRQNRRNWMFLAAGVLMEIASKCITQDHMSEFLQEAAKILNRVFESQVLLS